MSAAIALIITIGLGNLDAGQGYQNKQCWAPVVCNVDNHSQPSWQQVYPPIGCQENLRTSSAPSRGLKGEKGEPGPASSTNQTRLQQLEEGLSKIQESNEEANNKLATLETKYNKFEKTFNDSVDKIHDTLTSNVKGSQHTPSLSTTYPQDCKSVQRKDAKIRQSRGGVFDIYPESRNNSVEVYCDLETDGGGWTVFQRRMDGSVDFYREWEEYAAGFGEKDKEMWLGLETIYQLTKSGGFELRVDMTDWQGNMAYAKYGQFAISSRSDNYRLTVGQFSGDAGDSLSSAMHSGQQFSAFNADFDTISGHNCAEVHRGGWWFANCLYSNLNGIYYNGPVVNDGGVTWHHWKSSFLSLQIVEMKFRKK